MDATGSKRVDRVNLACIQCRSRHVKCDATQPVCNRCSRDGKECVYQKSRRGGLDKAALARRRLKLQQGAELAQQTQTDTGLDGTYQHPSQSQSQLQPSSESSPRADATLQDDIDGMRSLNVAETRASGEIMFTINDDRLLELFFSFFWPSFPVVMPIHFFRMRLKMPNHGMEELLKCLEYIGSLYAPWAPSEPYYQAVLVALSVPHLPRTPFNVSALMLFAVSEHHQGRSSEARLTMDLAIGIALELHMNEKGFAQAYGEENPVLEECWRRTWYSLHVNDQHLSVVSSTPMYTLSSVRSSVDLPCDNEFFETGNMPSPLTWQDYENREFAEVEVVYSSLVYMYDVSRIVLHVMNHYALTGSLSEELIDHCDAKIAIWQSLLPKVKRDPLQRDGQVDEVMFMAHMMAIIILMTIHRPLSTLKPSVAELSTTSFHSRALMLALNPNTGRSSHTARALRAAEMHTKLLAIPCDMEKHNVFIMNITAQIAIASVSACINLLEDHALSIARDRIRLSIGFLNTMGTVWKLGKDMAKEVRSVARSTLNGAQSTQQNVEPNHTGEIEFPRDELIWPVDPSAQINIYAGLELPGNWGNDSASNSYRSSSDVSTPLDFGQDFNAL